MRQCFNCTKRDKGHQDKRHVREMLKKELQVSLKLPVPLVTETCKSWIYGKSHKLPFGNRGKCTKHGELMSVDVCRPFDESFQRKKYLVQYYLKSTILSSDMDF